ncbi:unnamed protein product [Effrenium voratum]|uniref:Uncharacterized protein n=1 Tax=Effrenium voratum TaxID=2562239 RepID=A0AA36HYX4_9DINO|nr:unnamed protein product [Effrenium voratum]CAJ1420107.1 unnamed protein product [Effrenium voratum]
MSCLSLPGGRRCRASLAKRMALFEAIGLALRAPSPEVSIWCRRPLTTKASKVAGTATQDRRDMRFLLSESNCPFPMEPGQKEGFLCSVVPCAWCKQGVAIWSAMR